MPDQTLPHTCHSDRACASVGQRILSGLLQQRIPKQLVYLLVENIAFGFNSLHARLQFQDALIQPGGRRFCSLNRRQAAPESAAAAELPLLGINLSRHFPAPVLDFIERPFKDNAQA